ncbi:microtubule-associated protein 2 isoform X9 [Eucyclogobius newberryi]|uniref:microtubule-associated protein 2 isoform X9 n=1 Tax=Eucyclogobius newberryi TaxID=166745 RepID=UPI003B5A230B
MADSRQPEDGAPQWSPSSGQEASSPLGANGYPTSSFRTCQTGTIMSSGPYSARENGFNGDLSGAHAITAEQVSARIVQEVTAEAVAVLKGEQESQRLPSVEDATNLPPSPPPSPAAEHFGPLEQALKMETDKQIDEKSGSISPDSIGSEKRPDEPFETPLMQEFFAGERVVPESPTMDMPAFVTPNVSNKAKECVLSFTLQPTFGEPITVTEKQPSVEVVEFTSIAEPSEFSSVAVKVEEVDAKDRSGMSAYFETSAIDEDQSPQYKGEGYYELSRSDEKVETQAPEISYSTLGEAETTKENAKVMTVPDRSNECRLSPGKLALEQRSYSLNITIGAMDPNKPRNFSPLASDILSYTSGSLDESADYLPVTTPAVEKTPICSPLIMETTSSITESSSPPKNITPHSKSSSEPESPQSPEPTKTVPKNGGVMAQDLPEMLDLSGNRSRVASDSTEPDTNRKKSLQCEAPALDDPMASMISGQLSPRKSDSQLEEMGYCVFSEYSGPMPSPADVFSSMDNSGQVFSPTMLEEKMSEQVRKMAVRDTSLEDKGQPTESGDTFEAKDKKERKDSSQDQVKDETVETLLPEKQTESFVTPTVTVTLEEGGRTESESDQQASRQGSVSETEIADYERQIRKLEMEDRPLSMEEERELQELREKVKLVHQEAYEELDAEDVYQLTGAAKDRIARPVKPSPASSVDSNIDDDKLLSPVLSPSKMKQKELYGSPKRSPSPTKEEKEETERKLKEEREREEAERKLKEEEEKKLKEEEAKKLREASEKQEAERKLQEEKAREEKIRLEREMKEREELELREKAEREKREQEREESERKEREERERKEKEEKERIEKEERERKEKEEKERCEREERERKERERKEKEEKERLEKEEREQKEKEEKEKREKEEQEKLAKELIEKERLAQLGMEEAEKARQAETGEGLMKDVPEKHAAIESVVTVEDDFITVVQTIDKAEEPGHSVRFSAPIETLATATAAGAHEEEEEEVEIAQEAELEGGSVEEVCEVPETPACPEKETVETEEPTESYDRDETTMDDSILDSSWVDTQDDDKSMATEQIEPLPNVQTPVKQRAGVQKKPLLEKKTEKQEKQVKTKTKTMRPKGRISTPERKPVRKEPTYVPREEVKKKKALVKKTEMTKKAEVQTHSPARRTPLRAAVRQTRPVQHHSCPRRRTTETLPDGRQPLSVARQSRDRASCHRSPLTKIPTSMSRPAATLDRATSTKPYLFLYNLVVKDGGSRSPIRRYARPTATWTRRVHQDPEDSSTSITSSGSTAPRRPTSFQTEMSAEFRTGRAPMTVTQTMRSRSARSGHSTPRTPGSTAVTPCTPPSYSSSRTPRSLSLISHERKVAVVRTPPKSPATTPKQLRIISEPLPDYKNVKSKIGSTGNIKYQPKGGQVLIPSVKLDYSHVQSRCGSLDRRGFTAGGRHVQIQNKKIDLSHVTSKCGSLDNIHHRPGGGNVRIESVKLDFKDKAQAKVGSLENAHHAPGGGRVLIECHRLMFRDQARAQVDHGADIMVQSQRRSGSMSPSRRRESHLSSSGSLNFSECPQLSTLAKDVTEALAKQGL